MSEPAMRPTGEPVDAVLDRARGPRRPEVDDLLEIFEAVSGEQPVVWASRIVGFGDVDYRLDSGRTGTMPLLAFAPGASQHTIYLTGDYTDLWPDLVERLGKHRTGKACLYLTRLSDVDRDVLIELLERTLDHARAEWPSP